MVQPQTFRRQTNVYAEVGSRYFEPYLFLIHLCFHCITLPGYLVYQLHKMLRVDQLTIFPRLAGEIAPSCGRDIQSFLMSNSGPYIKQLPQLVSVALYSILFEEINLWSLHMMQSICIYSRESTSKGLMPPLHLDGHYCRCNVFIVGIMTS